MYTLESVFTTSLKTALLAIRGCFPVHGLMNESKENEQINKTKSIIGYLTIYAIVNGKYVLIGVVFQ